MEENISFSRFNIFHHQLQFKSLLNYLSNQSIIFSICFIQSQDKILTHIKYTYLN